MNLEVGRAVVDGFDAAGKGVGQLVPIDQLRERGRGVEVGDDDRGGDHLPVAQGDALDPTLRGDDLGDLDVTAKLATIVLEQSSDMVGHGADAAAHLGHRGVAGRRQGEGEAQRAPRGVGPQIGGVDGQKAEHASDLGVLVTVGKKAIDNVHDTAEHGRADRLPLGLVRRALPHLVERLGRPTHVESPDRPGRRFSPGRHLGHTHDGVEAQGIAEMREQPLGVGVEQDRRLARRTDAGRLHLGLVDGTGVESEVLEDLVREEGTGSTRPARSGSRGSSSVEEDIPPMKWFFSRHRTRKPPRAMTAAAVSPLCPAPMTMAS